ncbi:MAG: Asp-tRNA(Asn)/Glu-tRNA(Gln) amidotransferase subunit GatC [Actinomycetota bacterium]
MSGEISRDEVAHVASLARLRLTDDELTTFTDQLCVVLETAAQLNALDLDDVEPMAQPYPLSNVLRPDVVVESLDRDEVLSQAPAAEDGRFRVPPALGEAP